MVAALTKLSRPENTAAGIRGFGVPSSFVQAGVRVLPALELVLALLLVPALTSRGAAIGALLVLAAFTVAMVRVLVRGEVVDCNCFGVLSRAPVTWRTVGRNAVLALAAGIVVVGDPAEDPWAGAGGVAFLATIAIAVVIGISSLGGWFMFRLLEQHGALLLRVEAIEAALAGGSGTRSRNAGRQWRGLAVGAPAPEFDALSSLLRAGRPLLLLFTDTACGPCEAILPDVGRWQRDLSDRLTLALITRGKAEEARAKAEHHRLDSVVHDADGAISKAYATGPTPSAVLVDSQGKIASELALGPEAIRELVSKAIDAKAASSSNAKSVARVGQPAPSLKLPNLDGNEIALADFAGEDTLVLFWNPKCGYCRQMAPNLRAWEQSSTDGAPRLLIVSTGSEHENRAIGLLAPVVLDQSGAAMRAFGASGTPMAALVSKDGNLAGPLAQGADEIFALARGQVHQQRRELAGGSLQ
jgi:thiol-disulfide isomerase/thioredoxin